MDACWFWLAAFVSVTVIILSYFFRIVSTGRRSLHNLDGKHILITGGSSGIGKSLAIEAAKLGANVTIIARDVVMLEASVNEIQNYCICSSQTIRSISLDVSKNYDYIERTLHVLEDSAGPVYMLINCAGMAICGILEDLSMNDVHHLINLNFLGNLHTIKALLPRMKSRKEGHIVITASQAALVGIYGLSVYSCTKFALRGLAESLHMEVLPFNIKITLATPPDTDTPGLKNENKSKPLATRLISMVGGLYKPEIVGERIMKDALDGTFFSTVGFDNKMVTALCSGMSPANSFFEVVAQCAVMGIMRLMSYYYQWSFQCIIKKCLSKKYNSSDEENGQ